MMNSHVEQMQRLQGLLLDISIFVGVMHHELWVNAIPLSFIVGSSLFGLLTCFLCDHWRTS